MLLLEAPPLPAALNMPEDSAVEIPLKPQFLWVPSSDADSYTLQVATDMAFNNIVATTTTNITVYTLPDELDDNTVYYWRILATGACGDSESVIRSFTTIIIDDIGELNNSRIDIRPNPTNGKLNIALSAALPGDLQVEVYSINGQRLSLQNKNGETQFDISLENYPSGVYCVKLVNGQNVLTRKIILQR